MGQKRVIDWEGVERDYRAGVLTFREMEERHAVSVAYIRKHAASHGWGRDLNAKIQARADAIVHKAECTESAQNSERALIDANAQAIAEVKLGHRSNIKTLRQVVAGLIAELESETEEDLKARVQIAKTASDALKNLIGMEREAWGLVSTPEKPAETPQEIDPIEGARRLAFALHRAATMQPQQIH